MEVKKDINILDVSNWWSGGEDTVRRCIDAGKGNELVSLIEEHFTGDIPSEEDVNDLLRFDDDWIFETLGIDDEEDEEDEEEDEEEEIL